MNLTPWLINHFRDAVAKLEVQIQDFPDSIYFLRCSHPAYGSEMVFTIAKEEDLLEIRIFDNLTDFYFYNTQQDDIRHKPFQKALQIMRKPYDPQEDDQDEMIITHDGKFCWGCVDLLIGEVRLQPERSRLKEIIHLIQCLTQGLALMMHQPVQDDEIFSITMDQEDKISSSSLKIDRIDVAGCSLLLDEETLENFKSFKKTNETLQVDVVGFPDFSMTLSPHRLLFRNFILFCSTRHQFHNQFGHYCDEDIIEHLAISFQEYFLLYGIPSRIHVNHLWTQFSLEPFCNQLGITLVLKESLEYCDGLGDELCEAMQMEKMDLLDESKSFN